MRFSWRVSISTHYCDVVSLVGKFKVYLVEKLKNHVWGYCG